MGGYINKNRWVDLSGLPRSARSGRCINWRKCDGFIIPFKYDDVCGKINIIQYDHSVNPKVLGPHIYIVIDKYVPIPTSIPVAYLRNCHLHNLVGNKIINKAPWMLEYLVNELDAYKYTYGSGTYLDVECPRCGRVHKAKPTVIFQYGFSCPMCGDGFSLPNKIMRNVLTRLKIPFIAEVNKKHFKWMDKYKYDFYININNSNIIVEMDGGYHKQQQETDLIKTNLVLSHQFDIIRIDCDYNCQPFEYIKNNILNSKLSSLICLSEVDWKLCKKETSGSLIAFACELWECREYSLGEIAETIKCNKITASSYLQYGFDIGLCPSYDKKEVFYRGSNPYLAVCFNGTVVSAFRHVYQLCLKANDIFGTDFHLESVRACYNKKQTYKGYNIKTITKEEYLRYKMIKYNNKVV